MAAMLGRMSSRLELRILRVEDDRDLAFAEYGDPDGAAVFGFHGTPGSHMQVTPMADTAAELGVRLIVPDRPGYGHSSFSADRALTDWPNDVQAIADELGIERFGVFGVSGGGPHAAVCAYGLGEAVTSCALVSGVGPLADPEDAEDMMPINRMFALLARRAPRALRVPFGAINLAARLLPEEKIKDSLTSQMPPSDVEIMSRPEIADALLGDMRRKHLTSAKAAAQDFQLFAEPWGFRLDEITVPVHIWHGTEDVNVPIAHAHRYAELIVDSTLHLAEGEGHMLVYERAAEILGVFVAREGGSHGHEE